MVRELYFLLIYESTWFTMPSMSTHDSIARIRQPVTFLPRKYSTFALFSFLLRKMIESTAVECNTLIKVGTRTRSLSQSVSQSVRPAVLPSGLPSLLSFLRTRSSLRRERRPLYIGESERPSVRLSLCHTTETFLAVSSVTQHL